MRWAFVIASIAALVGAPTEGGEEISVPSGQAVTYLDTITDARAGLAYRFRFVAPEIGDGMDLAVSEGDMAHLCVNYALPRVSRTGPQPARIVITLTERPVAFGAAAPEVVQFFESYDVRHDTCIWEPF